MIVGGFVIVALAAAAIGAILTYIADELRHERLDRIRETSIH